MQHSFFFDGNEKNIAWVIQTNYSKVQQVRKHADIYLNKVTKEQSKFIALHVGLFWGIGRFIIKNRDRVTINTDDEGMFNHLIKNKIMLDDFIITRTHFIYQLINQRKLQIEYQLILQENNFVSRLI